MSELMRTRGITLVELIAVIVVLAILGAIAVPSYMDHVNQSRMIGYIEHMNTIMRVCGQHETDTGFWNGTGTISYSSGNQTTHALKNYFDGKPLNAFGGTWWYGANATTNMRFVSGSGLPVYGSTPESCSKFITLRERRWLQHRATCRKMKKLGIQVIGKRAACPGWLATSKQFSMTQALCG